MIGHGRGGRPVDGLFLHASLKELEPLVRGSRVDRISQPRPNTVLLTLYGRGGRCRIIVDVTPGTGALFRTGARWTNPPQPPVFTMVLRKHLLGLRLVDLGQAGLDRAAWFRFRGAREGRPVERVLQAEFFGPVPRLVLLDAGGTVIDALRRLDPEAHDRPAWPGMAYEPPPAAPGRWDPLTGDPEVLPPLLARALAEPMPPERAVTQTVAGVGPLLGRESVYRALALDPDGADPGSLTARRLAQGVLAWALPLRREGPVPTVLWPQAPDGPARPRLTAVDLEGHRRAGETVRVYDTCGEAADAVLAGPEAAMDDMRRSLQQAAAQARRKVQRLVTARRLDLSRGRRAEEWRRFADLLTANLWRWPGGRPVGHRVSVPDLESPEGPPVEIPLDPTLSPAKNAEVYYDRYRKARRTVDQASARLAEAEADLAYIDSFLLHLEQAETEAEVAALVQEWEAAAKAREGPKGKGRAKAPRRDQDPQAGEPRRFVSREGLPIYVGRNNKQNDWLVFQKAAPHDLWFHARGIPGAHVVVRLPHPGAEAGPDTIHDAAVLAAYYSQARNGANVPVDWVPVKRVKKIPGQKPGMVRYEGQRTLWVTPDPALVEALRR